MEKMRLAATRELELLDTEPEEEFDQLTRLAAKICGTPMSTITLLDEHRQWFKSKQGVAFKETPREISFCNVTVRSEEMLLVEDATKDRRFHHSPLVSAGIRFYAGVPLSRRDGFKVGTLCVMDSEARQLTSHQQETLAILARQVEAHMELRVQRRVLHRALEERSALLAELAASDQLFRTFMHYSPIASFIKDHTGTIVYCNRRMAESAGTEMAAAVGQKESDLWPASIANRILENDRRALLAEDVFEVDETTEANGEKVEWRSFRFPWKTSSGEQMLAGIRVDVTADKRHQADLDRYRARLEEANAQLTLTANTDALTGLANRRALDDGIEAAVGTSVIPGREIAILTIDVDHFKQVNDTYGHSYGDVALRQIARIILHCTAAQDLVARSGGEEFTVILPASGSGIALDVARRILKEVQHSSWAHQPITVSIGASTMTIDDGDLNCVLKRSDRALYEAKRQGRNRVIYLTKTQACLVSDVDTRAIRHKDHVSPLSTLHRDPSQLALTAPN